MYRGIKDPETSAHCARVFIYMLVSGEREDWWLENWDFVEYAGEEFR